MEIRVYPGRDADFTVYEDQGDGYAYERGRRAAIPIHWDDQRHLLTIGPTVGSFVGMRMHHAFRIVNVRAGHGTGILPDEDADRVVEYDGRRRVSVQLPSR